MCLRNVVEVVVWCWQGGESHILIVTELLHCCYITVTGTALYVQAMVLVGVLGAGVQAAAAAAAAMLACA